MTRRFALVFLTLVGAAPLAFAQEAAELRWETSWNVAFKRARAERRLVFVDYWAVWCEPCMEMERRTFPDPRVIEQLRQFVLLKMNVDVQRAAIALPTYKFFDPWETERLRFLGFRPPEDFARKVALVADNAPAIVRAAESLREQASASGHLLLGQALFGARASSFARDELETAAKLARREGDAALAQTAETQAAMTWAMEGKAPKALKILEKIAAQPANPECAAGAWIAIGEVRAVLQDAGGATEAYRRALSVCPDHSPLRPIAQTALAAVEKTQ